MVKVVIGINVDEFTLKLLKINPLGVSPIYLINPFEVSVEEFVPVDMDSR